ncbi:TPA: sugar transferase [Streptococcus suis]
MYPVLKRVIDIVISGLAIVVLSPVLLLIAIAIKLDSKGPVLFKQKRVGKKKSHFMIYKFRSMYVDTPSDMPTHLLKDPTAMITKVGAFLRKTSLDELPQLFNIFKGEMAIVGPRPALWNQYDLIEERDKYGANNIQPGLTGWAQINGRDELEIDIKARLDGEYAEKIGLLMDVRCFFWTIFSVLRSDGVVEGGTGVKAKTTDINSSNSKAEETVK